MCVCVCVCTGVWEVNSAKIKWCTLYIKQVEMRRACRSGGACPRIKRGRGLVSRVEGPV